MDKTNCIAFADPHAGTVIEHCLRTALVVVATACFVLGASLANACPDPDDVTTRGYPYNPDGEEITVKFVFISFPGSDQTELRESTHKRFPEKFAEYFESISDGKLTFSEDTGILFKYVDGELDTFDVSAGDSTAVPWTADLGATHYEQNPNYPPEDPDYQEHHLTQEYLQEWEGRVGSWWVTSGGVPKSNFATELSAEILWKIHENYTASGINQLEEIDSLQLVFLHSFEAPFYAGVGGRPDVHVLAQEVEADTAPFFSQLRTSGSVYEGTIQGGGSLWNEENSFIGYTHEFIDNAVRVVCHEFAHTLGPLDGPPSLYVSTCSGYPNRWCEERYYYGTLNLLDQHRVRRSAIAPISTPWMKSLPWREVVDFTGQNLMNVPLDDLMLGGKIYKYQLASDEAILITYRAGNGVDVWLGADGLPALKSHGVEIWHVWGGKVHDLESGVKLWNIDELVPPVYTIEDALAHPGLAEDPVDGYDNYDLWRASDGVYRDPLEYGPYDGDANDFFPPAQSGASYLAYSWDTNPSCFGYSRSPEHADLFRRRRPQIEPSSLEVTIREVSADGNTVYVDLITAPYEEITYPDESVTEPFAVNDQVPITWTTDYAEGDHTIDLTLDLYYLPVASDPSLRFLIPGGEGIESNPENQPFVWTVQPTDPSDEAAILAVFHNPYSSHVWEDLSATFQVAGDQVPRELLLLPESGAEWISGMEYEVRWTDGYDPSTFAGVSIEYRVDGASAWYDLATDLTEGAGGYTYDEAKDENFYAVTPDNDMASGSGQLRLRFEYYIDGGGTAISHGDVQEPIAVYPVYAQFADQTGNIDEGYEGLPSSIAPVVTGAFNNELGGIVVAIGESALQSTGELYFVSSDGDGIYLNRRTQDYLPSSVLPVGTSSVSVADYDNDGDDDLFACWPGDDTASRLLILNGTEYEEITEQGVNPFQGISPDLLDNVQCSSWIDYDHDGDLDLYLGRAVVELGDSGDPNNIGEKLSPLRDCLLDNDDGVFTEVGVSVGLVDPGEAEATQFAIWADCDHDGQWELLVGGGAGGYGTRHFRETSYRQFEADDMSPVAGTNLIDAHWADIDNDGFLDVIGLSAAGVEVFHGQAGGMLGSPVLKAAITSGGSLSILDYDLDGWRDLLLGAASGSSQRLLANFMEDSLFPNSLVDVSVAAQIVGNGIATSAFTSDLDQDGDPDIVIGRENCATGSLLANELRDPVTGGDRHYLGLRLVSGVASGSHGATVILTDANNDLLGIRVVEGGGNRGSQASRDLIFGLGDYDGAVDAKIHWPLGRVQSYTISANDIDQFVTVVEPVQFSIDRDSVVFRSIFGPFGEIMWQFDWITDNWTVADLDQVTVIGDPEGCEEETIILRPGDPDVVHLLTYAVDPGGDGIYYHHRLTYQDAPCDPSCVIEYSVGSNNGMWVGLLESTDHIGKTPKVCPLSQ